MGSLGADGRIEAVTWQDNGVGRKSEEFAVN
jgi:hypothetical protein